jgi:hypothetical protein
MALERIDTRTFANQAFGYWYWFYFARAGVSGS